MAEQAMALTPEQVKRYSRHIIMGDVGSKGQRNLLQSKALIVGAGGLGSPSAIYLALAGVGTIGIVDFDVVEISNLQRQILHHTADIGRPKLESAKDNIKAYNPDVNIVMHGDRLESHNAMEIISQYDLVINGADNFATRYLVNDACYLSGKPLVDGSILIFDGQSHRFHSRPRLLPLSLSCPSRLPAWCPTAPKRVYWALLQASWAAFKRPKP